MLWKEDQVTKDTLLFWPCDQRHVDNIAELHSMHLIGTQIHDDSKVVEPQAAERGDQEFEGVHKKHCVVPLIIRGEISSDLYRALVRDMKKHVFFGGNYPKILLHTHNCLVIDHNKQVGQAPRLS